MVVSGKDTNNTMPTCEELSMALGFALVHSSLHVGGSPLHTLIWPQELRDLTQTALNRIKELRDMSKEAKNTKDTTLSMPCPARHICGCWFKCKRGWVSPEEVSK